MRKLKKEIPYILLSIATFAIGCKLGSKLSDSPWFWVIFFVLIAILALVVLALIALKKRWI